MDIVLSKSTWPIIGWVCQILGWLINGIYFCLEKIGIPNIGIAIILYTIIIYLVLTPLQIKQQKMSKMMSVMQPDLQRIEKKYHQEVIYLRNIWSGVPASVYTLMSQGVHSAITVFPRLRCTKSSSQYSTPSILIPLRVTRCLENTVSI